MNMYVIRFIDGSKLHITEEEYQKLAGKTGLVFFPDSKQTINLSSVSRIYPMTEEARSTDRSKQTQGILHDGSVVVKQFGQWFLLDGEKDEKGNLETRPDPEFYPEIRYNCIPTPQEYENTFKFLPVAEWTENILFLDKEKPQYLVSERKSTQGWSRISM